MIVKEKYRKLRQSKKIPLVLHIAQYLDKVNGNTYSRISQAYQIIDGKRRYLRDHGYFVDEHKKVQLCSDPWEMARQYLQGAHGWNLSWFHFEHQNVIISSEKVSHRKFNSL